MRDITLEDTFYIDFTTRSFATGVPTLLSGSPVLSVLEENNITPITAGVSVAVDRASVVGLNMATIVGTAANGYEAGKGYSVYISTGTVGGVSVVGEVVGQFTIQANPVNWAKVTDPTTAVDLSGTDIQLVDTVTTYTGNTLQTGDSFARLGAPAGASVSADILVIDNFVDGLETTIGTAGAGLTDITLNAASIDLIWDETMAGHVTADTAGLVMNDWQDGGRLDLIQDIIAADTTTDIPALIATAQADLDTITGSDGVTLATAQALYAPNVVVPDAAGVVPTAIENADALLNRDMSTGTDSGSASVRTVRQALRFLRNKWSIAGTTLTVTKEDDTAASWTAIVSTDAAADPVIGSDPA